MTEIIRADTETEMDRA